MMQPQLDPVVPRWMKLTAGDVMQTRILTVADSAPVSEVERVLTENRISGVPVTDQTGRVVGVVSVKDLLDRYVEDPDARPRRRHFFSESMEELDDEDLVSLEVPDAGEETASDLMNPEVFRVSANATLTEVARVMTQHRIHRVLVTDPETGRVAGILTTMGVLAAISA
jgi:CBS domain-containing protein